MLNFSIPAGARNQSPSARAWLRWRRGLRNTALLLALGMIAPASAQMPGKGTGETVVGVGEIFAKGGVGTVVVYGALLLVFMVLIGQWLDRRASRAFSQDVMHAASEMARAVSDAAQKYSDSARLMGDAIEKSADRHGENIAAAVNSMMVQHARIEGALTRVEAVIDRANRG